MEKEQIISFIQNFVIILSDLVTYAIIARVLLSWFMMSPNYKHGSVATLIYQITDPVLNFFKKIPHRIGMIDLSPIIAIFAIDIFSRLLIILLAKI